MTPQETESDLLVSVLESQRVSIVACLQIRGTGGSSPGRHKFSGRRLPLALPERLQTPGLATSGQTTEREHSPTHQQKIGLKIY